MKTKRKLLVLSVLLIVLFLSACGQTANQEPNAPQASETVSTDTSESNSENTEFTIEELAEYNGKDGKPAYIAVDGVVYNVTNASPWKDGEHNGFEAGKVLSDEIKNSSPHGISKLRGLPEVGTIVE